MPNFKALWDNFPDADEVKKKCFNRQPASNGGDRPFDNYCSILLSECFTKSGIAVDRCPGVKCWSHKGAKHVIRAEELAAWLDKSPPADFKRRETVTPSTFQKDLSGRTGVIFFKDYWTRGRESFANRSGDHIDLWKDGRITGSSMFFRSISEFFGLVSDLNKSRAIWFWEIK